MAALAFLFLYGLAAGFVLLRLSRRRRRGKAVSRGLNAAGWLLFGLSIALALGFIAWGLADPPAQDQRQAALSMPSSPSLR